MENTIPARHFNSVVRDGDTMVKSSENSLNGEIFWYRNTPEEIKHLFPRLLSVDGQNSYKTEWVGGHPLTFDLLDNTLTKEKFIRVLKSIERIHRFTNEEEIPSHYEEKFKIRCESFDYSVFPHALEVQKILTSWVVEYNRSWRGKTFIHGDPVFGNILVDGAQVKFIDMRGEWGGQLTQSGDPFYDWGKVFQSLIGYDAILLGRPVTANKEAITWFDEFLCRDIQSEAEQCKIKTRVRMIAAYLLFTLIPLHNDEDKQQAYYRLAVRCMALQY